MFLPLATRPMSGVWARVPDKDSDASCVYQALGGREIRADTMTLDYGGGIATIIGGELR